MQSLIIESTIRGFMNHNGLARWARSPGMMMLKLIAVFESFFSFSLGLMNFDHQRRLKRVSSEDRKKFWRLPKTDILGQEKGQVHGLWLFSKLSPKTTSKNKWLLCVTLRIIFGRLHNNVKFKKSAVFSMQFFWKFALFCSAASRMQQCR